MPQLHETATDGLQVRAASGFTIEDGQFIGRAVPYGHTIELYPGLKERFEHGAFSAQAADPARVKIAYRHGEIIGRAVELEERADGLWVRGLIIDDEALPDARKALAQLRAGLVDELSVGFQTVRNGTKTVTDEHGTTTWIHTRAALREISVVPWGAYGPKAAVKKVRDTPTNDKVAQLAAEIESLRLA